MIIKDESKLRQPCISRPLDESMQVGLRLLDEVVKHAAIGLAANQIGEDARVFVLLNSNTKKWEMFIDPEVISYGVPITFEGEGCLSFPNQFVTTTRHVAVIVKDALDPTPRRLDGINAICFQHELDHLDGIVMFDHIVEPEMITEGKK